MNKISIFFSLLFILPFLVYSQGITVTSFSSNPLEVNPLTGGNLTVNYTYTSEAGSTGNHIYIGLELLDGSNTFISTITEKTLQNQSPGTNITGSVSFFIPSFTKLSANLSSGNYYQVIATLYTTSWTANAWSGFWNTPKTILQNTSSIIPRTNAIAKGADVSWMTEMEASSFTWKDNSGTTKQLMPLLKEYELNAVRLRVWVNPANGWCNITDMVNKAKLANVQGLDVMVCIHYSDSWADPGKQNKPAAWTSMTVPELETAVYNHTTAILTALAAENITPKWVQIGNETSDGMLWTTGKASASGFDNYAKFVIAGNNAVKTFNSSIKTIVHLANGYDNTLFRWNIDGLVGKSAQFDIIGMSLYPDANNWITYVNNTYSNMLDMKSRYSKDVMITEIGFSSTTPNIAYQFVVYILEKTREAGGLGVFYWEPIAYNNWQSYSKGAWDSDGSPSVAMDAFIDYKTLSIQNENEKSKKFKGLKLYPNPVSDKLNIDLIDKNINKVTIYDIAGRELKVFKDISNLKLIDISELSIGIYLLETNTKQLYKFIKK